MCVTYDNGADDLSSTNEACQRFVSFNLHPSIAYHGTHLVSSPWGSQSIPAKWAEFAVLHGGSMTPLRRSYATILTIDQGGVKTVDGRRE